MPKQQTDQLLQLIKSLSKAEKRHFRLFVKRNKASEDILFLQLFDMMDKQKKFDESMILEKIPNIKKRQLSNLKAHLYKQLLMSLRLLHKNYNTDIELRERIDYAKVLYNKGLYGQALEILGKARMRAEEAKLSVIALEAAEFEKHIESQYITRSIGNRTEELTKVANRLVKEASMTNKFSNLSLEMYALYLRVGYVRNEKEYYFVKENFNNKLPEYDIDKLDFYSKVYLFQSFVWYHYTCQEFLNCYRYAQRWVDLFEEEPTMKALAGPLYLKGLHNLLNALFFLRHNEKFTHTFKQLEAYKDILKNRQEKNIEGLYYLYKYIHELKGHFITGTFDKGLEVVPELNTLIEENPYNWDSYRILLFNYRIGCLYFGSSHFSEAIDYLNLIINEKVTDYRNDIQSYARILNLIAHYELGNIQLVEYQIKSVYRFLLKMADTNSVQKEIFKFLRKTSRIHERDLKEEFVGLRERLIAIKQKDFEQRPFLYLDIIAWLTSRIEGKTVQDTVRDEYLARKTSE